MKIKKSALDLSISISIDISISISISNLDLDLRRLPWWLCGKESAYNAGEVGVIPGSGRSPEKEMATHSSILAWHIPWTVQSGGLQSMGSEEPGGLQSLGLQTVLHVLSTKQQ